MDKITGSALQRGPFDGVLGLARGLVDPQPPIAEPFSICDGLRALSRAADSRAGVQLKVTCSVTRMPDDVDGCRGGITADRSAAG